MEAALRNLDAVRRALKREGGPVRLVRTDLGEYDPQAGQAPRYEYRYDGVGMATGYAQRDVDGTLVKAGDQRLLLLSDGVPEPVTGDRIEIKGKAGWASWSVVGARTVRRQGVDVLYVVQLRGLI